MTALLLAFLLFQASPTGYATGIVRSANGSPASGVRVYAIPAGDPNVASNGATVFESLAQTEESGRYRLEIPPGRYYIAVGSVNSPTYYPDTASIASAKAISIAAGSIVESVDFSRYTAAYPSPLGAIGIFPLSLPPGSTGVLSGVVRASDGTAAAGTTVRAVPVSVLNCPTLGPTLLQIQQIVRGGGAAVTDNQGRYRIENVTPDTYNIIAGYSDSPVFYPGSTDIQNATAITTSPTTMLTTLDFALPPPAKMFSIRGRVSANAGRPAGGATLNLQNLTSNVISTIGSLLPNRSFRAIASGGDGAFEIPDVIPGKYSLQARLPIGSPLTKAVEVVDHRVDIDFDFAVNVLSGRIVWEDGSPFFDPAVSQAGVSTISNPNFIATTLLPVSNNGVFSGVIDAGDYRFYLRSLPADYVIQTMTSGSMDLMKDALHVTVDVPSPVEIRVGRALDSGTRVRGRVLDAITGTAPAGGSSGTLLFCHRAFRTIVVDPAFGGIIRFRPSATGTLYGGIDKDVGSDRCWNCESDNCSWGSGKIGSTPGFCYAACVCDGPDVSLSGFHLSNA